MSRLQEPPTIHLARYITPWLTLVGLFAASGHAAAPCAYDVELLWGQTCGVFGPARVFTSDMAQDGTIVGSVEQCADPSLDEGFIWPSVGGPFVIPRPEGVAQLAANCINGRGQIGVFMSLDPGGHVYDIKTGGFTSIVPPPGATHSTPYAINDNGYVVGEWGNSLIGPSIQAFLWDGDSVLDLTPLLSGPKAIAFDINNASQVVGWTGTSQLSSTHIAFLWQDSQVTELGPIPGGTSSTTRSINELGQIAVSGGVPNPSGSGMVGRPFLWQKKKWIELGVLPGYTSCNARDINDSSQIIGTCTNPGTADESWYLWQDGVMTDLGQLFPMMTDDIEIEVDTIVAINNASQIAAYGTAWHPLHGPSQVGLRFTPKFHSPADFTGDCHVDSKDLAILLKSWGPLKKRNANPAADLDGDGVVNGFDLAMLLAAWG